MRLRSLSALIGLWALLFPASPAQTASSAAEFQRALDRLQVLGSVLYVAAHPDDENTAVLTACSKGLHLRTAYLSLTRGGGGQNLIGPEQGDALAAIRSQELLAARRLDGAEQFFTRAVDFGYSKTAEESLGVWGREAVLSDMVWVIRSFRPDVIVTRFPPDARAGHGHHAASAVLALEAFRAAADPSRFPEQLARVGTWKSRRLLWNTFSFDGSPPASGLKLDVGEYDPMLGKSYAELAAESRSLHRSQGFGAVPRRGSVLEGFELLAGDPIRADASQDGASLDGAAVFGGIDQTWKRIPGSDEVRQLLSRARVSYRPGHPAALLPLLLQARAAMARLPRDPWVDIKRQEVTEAIRCAAGLWMEAIADRQSASPGGAVTVTATALARGGYPVRVEGITLRPLAASRKKGSLLTHNQPLTESFSISLPADLPCSHPAWMQARRAGGLHGAVPMEATGLPEGPPALSAVFRIRIGGASLETDGASLDANDTCLDVEVPVQYRLRDPVLGERLQPFSIVPRVMVNPSEPLLVFGNGQEGGRELGLDLVAGADQVSGRVRLRLPEGWRAQPEVLSFALAKAGDELKLSTRITPPPTPGSGEIQILLEMAGDHQSARSRIRIDHPHIPLQTLLPPAGCRLVRVDLRHNGRRIGYVMGAGDEIPRSLRQLGYEVDLLNDEDLARRDLAPFDAIVVGIRAFNTRPRLATLKDRLLDYVARGGTEVVQYTVAQGGFLAQGPVTDAMGPYPFHLSRDRVTDEAAPMGFLEPHHALLTWPNRIGAADFEGWVQERGLYFADRWDPRYTPLFSVRDPGEKALEGGLLVARHGRGHFIYTGLSFFRQLPEGVPGAYRLFANLLAAGKRHE